MWICCRLKIAYCYGLRTWIVGWTLWTDADQTFTIHTPLLMGHNADIGVGMTWGAGHPWSSLTTAAVIVIVGLNREDLSGQSTDQTMQRCVMLLYVGWRCHVVAHCRRLAVYWSLWGGIQWSSLRQLLPCEFGVSCWAVHAWDERWCKISLSYDLWVPR